MEQNTPIIVVEKGIQGGLQDLELSDGCSSTRLIGNPSTNLAEYAVCRVGNEETPIHVNDAMAVPGLETDSRALPRESNVEPGSGAISQLGSTPQMNPVFELESATPAQTLEKNPSLGVDLGFWGQVHQGAPAAKPEERTRWLAPSGGGGQDLDDLGTDVIAAIFHGLDTQPLTRRSLGNENDFPFMSPHTVSTRHDLFDGDLEPI
jgi:hypothetical protein